MHHKIGDAIPVGHYLVESCQVDDAYVRSFFDSRSPGGYRIKIGLIFFTGSQQQYHHQQATAVIEISLHSFSFAFMEPQNKL